MSHSALAACLFAFIIEYGATVNCPYGYSNLFGEKCYRFDTYRQDYDGAVANCQLDGGDLVSIHSEEENNALWDAFFKDDWCFIGLFCDHNTNAFYWRDGTPYDYQHAGTECSYQSSDSNGTHYLFSYYDNTRWYYEDLYDRYHFICQHDPDEHTPTVDCPDGYFNLFGEKCYHFGSDYRSYASAIEYCRQDGGDLASIHSEEEQNALYVAMPKDTWCYIGLACDYNTNAFYWKDGTPYDYHHADPDCVYSYYSNETRYLLNYRANTRWYYDDLYSTFRYVCQRNPISDRCTGNGYSRVEVDPSSTLCMKVVDGNASWAEAEADCEADGAYLPSVHSEGINAFLRRTAISHAFTDGVFLGFKLGDSGDPSWVDGSALNYTNFGEGMPNNALGSCGAMRTNSLSGDWFSVSCEQPTVLPYICLKPN